MRNSQRGITLLELMIAAAMLAMIMVIAERAITAARGSAEVVERQAQRLRDIDRVWVLIENDLRNSVAQGKVIPFGEAIPAMRIGSTDDYIMMFIRSGQANPLLLPRTEVLRVAYRLDDTVLWRDSWIDPYNTDPELAREQQLLDGVEEFRVLALPGAPQGRSVEEGPWLDSWPQNESALASLPLAVEVVMVLEGRGEIRRIVSLVGGGS